MHLQLKARGHPPSRAHADLEEANFNLKFSKRFKRLAEQLEVCKLQILNVNSM